MKKTETHKKDHAAIEIPLSSDLPAGVLYLIPHHKKYFVYLLDQ